MQREAGKKNSSSDWLWALLLRQCCFHHIPWRGWKKASARASIPLSDPSTDRPHQAWSLRHCRMKRDDAGSGNRCEARAWADSTAGEPVLAFRLRAEVLSKFRCRCGDELTWHGGRQIAQTLLLWAEHRWGSRAEALQRTSPSVSWCSQYFVSGSTVKNTWVPGKGRYDIKIWSKHLKKNGQARKKKKST